MELDLVEDDVQEVDLTGREDLAQHRFLASSSFSGLVGVPVLAS